MSEAANKRRVGLAAAGLVGLGVAAWAVAAPPQPAAPAVTPAVAPQPAAVEVREAAVGRFVAGDGDSVAFEPTLTISATPGEVYGWQARVKTDRPTVRWREELTLPEAPRTWGEGASAPVMRSDDGRTAIIEQESTPDDGVIGDAWTVAEGDPTGRYELKLSIEGQAPLSFVFEVR